MVRDVGLAEDLAQDALVAALETWPRTGVPDNPGAWLMATAKHRAIDTLRRSATLDRKHEQIARELETAAEPDLDAALDDDIGDDLLRLVFTACHPVLPTEGRIALTLRLLGGLTTAEIARAFLVPETTLAQRITRAKRTLADAGVPFEVPSGDERVQRLGSVLEVVYLIFNEGYSATAGDDWMRPALCEDALRLGRILARILPGEGEVHGLVALMEIQQSRARARVGPGRRAGAAGRPGPRALGPAADRARAGRAGARRASSAALGPYGLQAAIAACHARARSAEETDWVRIARALRRARRAAPSPVVELNRAVAISMAYGPGAGLAVRRRARGRAGAARLPPAARACAATCSSGSAATPRRAPSSTRAAASRATRASASCCWPAHATADAFVTLLRSMASQPLIGITTSEVRRPEIDHPLPESEPPQPELALGMPYVRALARVGRDPGGAAAAGGRARPGAAAPARRDLPVRRPGHRPGRLRGRAARGARADRAGPRRLRAGRRADGRRRRPADPRHLPRLPGAQRRARRHAAPAPAGADHRSSTARRPAGPSRTTSRSSPARCSRAPSAPRRCA